MEIVFLRKCASLDLGAICLLRFSYIGSLNALCLFNS